MKFLIDSCISSFAVKALRGAGFDVVWIPETGPDPGDEAIIQQSVDEGSILVTADKDFGELVFVFNKPHSTIIRLVDIPARDQGKILLLLIKTHQDAIDKKALLTVDRHRVRIRLTDKTE
jgi:predicted nuclease of predicted toxin-antitoxin system